MSVTEQETKLADIRPWKASVLSGLIVGVILLFATRFVNSNSTRDSQVVALQVQVATMQVQIAQMQESVNKLIAEPHVKRTEYDRDVARIEARIDKLERRR